MSKESTRTDKSIKNLKYGITTQIIQYILSFITRTIFIYYLSKEYLGMNSIIMNILMILSLAESGVGSALQVLLYKPLHDNDFGKVNSLMIYFKKIFKVVSLIVLSLGILLLPITLLIIDITEVEVFVTIYILFLISSFVTYLSMPHQIIIKADQKSYIISVINQIFTIIQYIFQIFVLIFFQNFVIYILIQSLCTILAAYFKVRKSKKMYQFEINELLDKETSEEARKKIFAGFFHHLGYVVYNGTDNIVIASNINLVVAGIYSNYILIIGLIRTFLMIIYQSFFSSIGNLIVDSTKEYNYSFFKKISFISFILTGFAAICLNTLLNPFISLWIGTSFIFSNFTVFLICLAFLFDYQGVRKSIWIYKNATGLYEKDKFASLVEGIFNILISIILVKFWGINGVLIGTISSHILTSFWIQPKVVFTNYFRRSISEYYLQYFKYLLQIFIVGAIVLILTMNIVVTGWFDFFVLSLIVFSCSIFLLIIFNFRSEEFHYFGNVLMKKIKEFHF